MDGAEGALKNSFMTHTLDVKVTLDEFLDDFWTGNAETEVVSVDDIFVDNFFDFSDNELAEEEEEEKQNQQKEFNNSNSGYGSELCVPMDDLANIEWLSNFVDDSFFGYPLAFPLRKISENPRVSKEPCFMTKFRTKARSKRERTGIRVWSLGSLSFTDSSSCKQKKKEEREPIQRRRCTHCQVHKTPHWRTGPLGPKTLCNACGVRFRSGRLLPEYRPACSPTFSSEVHSNYHMKVLEMRKKKKVEIGLG